MRGVSPILFGPRVLCRVRGGFIRRSIWQEELEQPLSSGFAAPLMKGRAKIFTVIILAVLSALVCFSISQANLLAAKPDPATPSEVDRVLSSAAASGSLYHIPPAELAQVIQQADQGDEPAVLRLFGAVSAPAPDADPRIHAALARALSRGSANALKWQAWRQAQR